MQQEPEPEILASDDNINARPPAAK